MISLDPQHLRTATLYVTAERLRRDALDAGDWVAETIACVAIACVLRIGQPFKEGS